MGKVFKGIIVGALIGLTGGILIPFLSLGTLAAPFAGLFGLGTLAAATLGGAIVGGALALFAPSMDFGDVTARLSLSVNPNAGAVWVFGETAAATDVMFATAHGGKFASQIVACAAHEIESFGDFYIDDSLVSFTAGAATGDWAGVLWQQTNLGTETQTAFADIDADDDFAPGLWPATADGLGIAHYRLRWAVNEQKLADLGGIPSRITQVVKGCPVYDPRLDGTRGGTGAHRADDRSTWEYTNTAVDIGANWALIVLTYLLGWEWGGELVWGVGVDPDDIDMAQAIAAANVCAATIDSKPRYRIGGVIVTSQDHEGIIRQLEGAINGKVSTVGGKYYIWAPNNDLSAFSSIGESDIIRDVGVEFRPSGDIEKLYNTARGRYIDPTNIYQPTPYPDVVESTAVTTDGRVRSVDHDMAYVQDVSIAERVARQKVRRSRFSGTWRFAMGPKGLTFQPFTVTTLNCQETNNANVTVRVIDMTIANNSVLMTVLEEDASIYDTTAALGTPITQNDPGDQDYTGPFIPDAIIWNERIDAACTSGMKMQAIGSLLYATPAGGYSNAGVPAYAWSGRDPLTVDYWVKATVNSGTLTTGTTGSWISLATADTAWTILQSTAGVKSANVTLELSSDDAGATIVGSGDFDLKATYALPPATLLDTGTWYDSTTDGGTGVALSKPTYSTGDLLVVFLKASYITDTTPDETGTWTAMVSNNYIRAYYRIATSTSADDFTITHTMAAAGAPLLVGQMAAFDMGGRTSTALSGAGTGRFAESIGSAFPTSALGSIADNPTLAIIWYAKNNNIDQTPTGLTDNIAQGTETIGTYWQKTTGTSPAYRTAWVGWSYAWHPDDPGPAIASAEQTELADSGTSAVLDTYSRRIKLT